MTRNRPPPNAKRSRVDTQNNDTGSGETSVLTDAQKKTCKKQSESSSVTNNNDNNNNNGIVDDSEGKLKFLCIYPCVFNLLYFATTRVGSIH